jgi:hypothetical protein
MENPEEILSPKQATDRLKELEYRALPKRKAGGMGKGGR